MKKKKLFLILPVVALILACIVFLTSGYDGNQAADQAMQSTQTVTVTRDGRLTVFSPAQPEAGFVFYPGGRVDHTAYAPLMAALAEKNVLCVLVEMPLDLAILSPNYGADIPQQFPDISKWYIGGHSLGGSMAASCAAKNPDAFHGLVLLAAYSTQDLTQTDLSVLTIYGTQDGVLNMENYQEYYSNLPASTQQIQIRGGNHAFFGSYGIQKGDGIAAITAGEQLALTAAYLHTFFT